MGVSTKEALCSDWKASGMALRGNDISASILAPSFFRRAIKVLCSYFCYCLFYTG